MHPFLTGQKYRKQDIYKAINVPKEKQRGIWETGYVKYKNDIFIFTNVGTPGRTGHSYGNEFIGDELHWSAKPNTKIGQPLISEMLTPRGHVYIFFRTDNTEPFAFAGLAKAISHEDTTPVKITWKIVDECEQAEGTLPSDSLDLREGSKHGKFIYQYERNPAARQQCIDNKGTKCAICKFDFEETYGEIGKGFIHIHHITPLSERTGEYKIDIDRDLIPVCPNCHSMLHRKRTLMPVDQLRSHLKRPNQSL